MRHRSRAITEGRAYIRAGSAGSVLARLLSSSGAQLFSYMTLRSTSYISPRLESGRLPKTAKSYIERSKCDV
jgi:hypothetical protein